MARTFLLALGLTLAWALPAYAYDYSGPTTLSDPNADVESTPSVAINDAGDGVASWYVELPGTSAVRVAQHAPGGAWVTLPTPLNKGIAGAACDAFSSLDQDGNAMVVWAQWSGTDCGIGNQTILFSTRAAGAAAWSAPGAVGAAAPGNLDSVMNASSNASGQMVVAYETTDGTDDFVFGAIGSPTTGFDSPVTLTNAKHAINVAFLTTAIGDGGDAAVQWTLSDAGSSNVKISVRPVGENWTANAPSSITSVTFPAAGSGGGVAIDGQGDVLSTFTYDDGTTKSLASRYRPEGGSFQTKQTIAIPQAGYGPTPSVGFSAGTVVSDFDAAGNATVVWVESSLTASSPRARQLWTSTRAAAAVTPWLHQQSLTDIVGSDEISPHIDVAPSGAAIVSWGARSGTRNDSVAIYRDADGTFFPPKDLGEGIAQTVAIAPSGDALVGAIGAVTGDARVTVLDTQAPAISSMNVPAAATVGASVPMTGTVSDLWTGGVPAWDFGDGATGAGASVAHVFAAPGVYVVALGARDGAGNDAGVEVREITVTAAAAAAGGGSGGGAPAGAAGAGGGAGATATKTALHVSSYDFKAAYVASRLVATAVYHGTSIADAKLTLAIRRRGAKVVLTTAFPVKAGNWTKSVKLLPSMGPGDYDVTVTGPSGTVPAGFLTIAPPKAGIADHVYATGPRHGPTVSKIAGTSELWAHFHFGTLPKKGQAITTQWTLPSGKKLAANTRPASSLVEAQVKDLSGASLAKGVWHCVLRAGSAVVATLSVRVT